MKSWEEETVEAMRKMFEEVERLNRMAEETRRENETVTVTLTRAQWKCVLDCIEKATAGKY